MLRGRSSNTLAAVPVAILVFLANVPYRRRENEQADDGSDSESFVDAGSGHGFSQRADFVRRCCHAFMRTAGLWSFVDIARVVR